MIVILYGKCTLSWLLLYAADALFELKLMCTSALMWVYTWSSALVDTFTARSPAENSWAKAQLVLSFILS